MKEKGEEGLVPVRSIPAPLPEGSSLRPVVYNWGSGDSGALGSGSTRPRSRAEPLAWFQEHGISLVDVRTCGRRSIALASDGGVYEWGELEPGIRVAADGDAANAAASAGDAGAGPTPGGGVVAERAVHGAGNSKRPRRMTRDELARSVVPRRVRIEDPRLGTGAHHEMNTDELLASKTVLRRSETGMFTVTRDEGVVVDDGQAGDEAGPPAGGAAGHGGGRHAQDARMLPCCAVACGDDFGIAVTLEGGRVFTWGDGASGALGRGLLASHYDARPRHVETLEQPVTRVAAGHGVAAALCDDGSLHVWGTLARAFHQPIRVEALGTRAVTHVACGAGVVVAVTADGRVHAWGHARRGELGNGVAVMEQVSDAPVELVELRGHAVVDIAAGKGFFAAVNDVGEVFLWGTPPFLEHGGWFAPTRLYGVPPVRSIDCGEDHLAMIGSSTDAVFTFGANAHGQLGAGHADTVSEVVFLTDLLGKSAIRVACGAGFTAVLVAVDPSQPGAPSAVAVQDFLKRMRDDVRIDATATEWLDRQVRDYGTAEGAGSEEGYSTASHESFGTYSRDGDFEDIAAPGDGSGGSRGSGGRGSDPPSSPGDQREERNEGPRRAQHSARSQRSGGHHRPRRHSIARGGGDSHSGSSDGSSGDGSSGDGSSGGRGGAGADGEAGRSENATRKSAVSRGTGAASVTFDAAPERRREGRSSRGGKSASERGTSPTLSHASRASMRRGSSLSASTSNESVGRERNGRDRDRGGESRGRRGSGDRARGPQKKLTARERASAAADARRRDKLAPKALPGQRRGLGGDRGGRQRRMPSENNPARRRRSRSESRSRPHSRSKSRSKSESRRRRHRERRRETGSPVTPPPEDLVTRRSRSGKRPDFTPRAPPGTRVPGPDDPPPHAVITVGELAKLNAHMVAVKDKPRTGLLGDPDARGSGTTPRTPRAGEMRRRGRTPGGGGGGGNERGAVNGGAGGGRGGGSLPAIRGAGGGAPSPHTAATTPGATAGAPPRTPGSLRGATPRRHGRGSTPRAPLPGVSSLPWRRGKKMKLDETSPVFLESLDVPREERDDVDVKILCRVTRDIESFARLGAFMHGQVMRSAHVARYGDGEVIFEQGSRSAAWFIILFGSVDVKVRLSPMSPEMTVVAQLSAGQSFGERGLVQGGLRAATIVASAPCVMFRVDQDDYIRVMKVAHQKELEDKVSLLQAAPVLRNSSALLLQQLAGIATLRHLSAGDIVYTQGDDSEGLFLVQDGTCSVHMRLEMDVVRRGKNEPMPRLDDPGYAARTPKYRATRWVQVDTLEPPSYFGEIGLLRSAPRCATVRADTDATLLFLGREDFLYRVHKEMTRELRIRADKYLANIDLMKLFRAEQERRQWEVYKSTLVADIVEQRKIRRNVLRGQIA